VNAAASPFAFSFDTLGACETGGYDAVKEKGRRKAATSLLRSEDGEATDVDRRKMVGGVRDVRRNFTLLAWMVRRHLDYVTKFKFKAKTANKALNKKLEAIVATRSKRENFDVAGRHPLRRALRIAEGSRTCDGDVLCVRLNNRKAQFVEGDRIRYGATDNPPKNVDLQKLVHGVLTNDAGAALAYAISRRGRVALGSDSSSFVFEKFISAQNAYLHGYFDRFDQVRGVSPVITAINELRDTYEAFDYARAKMKVAQLFALAFYRDQYEDEEKGGKQAADGYEVDFGKGPIKLELDAGDRAEFLDSKTPSTETQAFCGLVILLALKALDLPYSFYREDFTNYSGSRGALLQYNTAAETKRDDNRDLLDWWTNWQFALSSIDGELPGVDLAEIEGLWSWIATGMPWIDPLKEILAVVQEIGAGVNSRTRVLAERGLDFEEDILPELIHEAKLLRDAGLPLNLAQDNALITALTKEDPQPATAA
jgi:capsid protein